MSSRVTARCPCRVDLAGGTLDIWPLGLLHPGSSTVNLAISIPVEAELSRRESGYRVIQAGRAIDAASGSALAERPETALVGVAVEALALPPFAAQITSGSPRGGGLGASSALVIALVAAAEALFGRPSRTARELAAIGRDLEARLMSLPTGTQDHYPALLGGVLAISHRLGGAEVRRLAVEPRALGASLVVAYSGQSHFSAGQNWQVVRRRLDGERRSVELFDGIANVAERAIAALEAGDLARVGELMDEEWSLRRQLAEGISTPTVERLLAAARVEGAWGGKVCGAGGGGSIAVLCPPERRGAVAGALAEAGGEILDCGPAAAGLVVDA